MVMSQDQNANEVIV